MMGANPPPSAASFGHRGRGHRASASRREEDHAKESAKADGRRPQRASPAPHDDDAEYAKKCADISRQVKLSEMKDEEFRRLLDPDTGAEGLTIAWRWDEARQDEFVSQLQPPHLSLILRKRMQAQLLQRAKTLTFRHLTVTQRGVEVLTDASGDLKTGEMVGLIGGPDSGVSPLLSALSQQLDKRSIKSGEVLYDGRPPTAGYTQAVGFAVKQDTHISALTVYESLYFSARMRVLDSVPDNVIRLQVKIVMKLLGLSHVADTIVGDAMTRGISGGEKRRLGFGLEMVAGHSCILADLPTNGLDSATAYGLLQTMSYSCKMGMCVMLSLVQASLELLTLLDRIILLCKGRIIYTGGIDTVEKYLKQAGFTRPKKKALPQFLEELSSKPEHFYSAKPNKSPSDQPAQAGGGADDDGDAQQQQPQQQQQGGGDAANSPQEKQANSGASPRSGARSSPQAGGGPGPASGGDGSRSPSNASQQQSASPRSGEQGESKQGDDAGKGGSDDGGQRGDSPPSGQACHDAWQKLVQSYEKSDMHKRTVQQADKDKRDDEKQQHKHPQQPPSPLSATKQQQQPDQPSPAQTAHAEADKQLPVWPGSPSSEPQQLVFHVDIDPLSPRKPPPAGSQSPTASAAPAGGGAGGDAGRHDKQVLNLSHHWVWDWWYARYNSGPGLQFRQNLHRHAVLTYRNTGLWRDIWILDAIIGLIVGSLFYQLGNDEVGVRNRLGLYFYLISYLGFNAVQLVPVLASQRIVLSNQTRSGYYHVYAYYFSLLLVQLPIVMVEGVLVLTPVWGLAELRGMDWGGRFWFAYFVLCLTSYTSRALMFVVYGASPNEAYADVLNQVTNIVFTKLCGYFIPQSEIVVGWHWVYYCSFFTFAFRALALNDILPIYDDCTPSPEQVCIFNTGAEALSVLYTMDPGWDKWLQVQYLVDFFIGYSLIGYLCMWLIDWVVMEDWEVPNFEQEDEKPQQQGQDSKQGDQQQQLEGQQGQGGEAAGGQQQQQQAEQQQPPSLQRRRSSKKPHPHSDIVIVDHDGEQELEDEDTDRAVSGDVEQGKPQSGHRPRPSSFHYHHRVSRVKPTEKQDGGAARAGQQKQAGQGVTMEFNELCYSVDVGGGQTRKLLDHVYGYCAPGMMVALMGATGAGKSTLLDLLANKKTGGHVTGSILVNGKERDASFQHLAGYVEQFDSIFPWSTIREALSFSGRLRLPPETSSEELERKVDETIAILGLRHLQHELVGGEGLGGVSQEVRKKVTIGVELMMAPQLLFLDEPTTGLDSAAAFAVMSTVRQLAKRISVICTIHQPSAEIVLMFDWLLLMRPGGQVVYFNPVRHLPDYFAAAELGKCPKDKNIADFALEQIRKLDSSAQAKKKDGEDGDEKKNEKGKEGGDEGKADQNKEGGDEQKEGKEQQGEHGQDEQPDAQQAQEEDKDGGQEQQQQGADAGDEEKDDKAAGDDQQSPAAEEEKQQQQSPHGNEADGGDAEADEKTAADDDDNSGDGDAAAADKGSSPTQAAPKADDKGQGKKGKGGNEDKGKETKQDMAKSFKQSEEGKHVSKLLKAGVFKKFKGKKPPDPNGQEQGKDGKGRKGGKDGEQQQGGGDDEKDNAGQQGGEEVKQQPGQQRSNAGEVEMGNTLRSRHSAARDQPSTAKNRNGQPQPQRQDGSDVAQGDGGEEQGGDQVDDGDQQGGEGGGGGDSKQEKETQVQAEPLAPIYTQFRVLLSREFLAAIRNRRNLGIRLFLAFFMAFVVGTVFWQLGYNNYEADERISAIFVTLLFLMFTANSFLPDLFAFRPMYFRETTAAMYTALPSFLARTVADLPFMFLEVIVLTIPIYFIVGLNPQRGHSPLGWLLFGFLGVRWTSITCTYFIGTLLAMPNNANTLQATYFNLQFAFTGFLIPYHSIPSWWKWSAAQRAYTDAQAPTYVSASSHTCLFHSLSLSMCRFYDLTYLHWALAFLAANESNGEEFFCDQDQRVDIPVNYNACSLDGDVRGQPKLIDNMKCMFTCGQDVLDYYGVSGSEGAMAVDICVLWGFAVFFAVAAFLSLKYVNHVKR